MEVLVDDTKAGDGTERRLNDVPKRGNFVWKTGSRIHVHRRVVVEDKGWAVFVYSFTLHDRNGLALDRLQALVCKLLLFEKPKWRLVFVFDFVLSKPLDNDDFWEEPLGRRRLGFFNHRTVR